MLIESIIIYTLFAVSMFACAKLTINGYNIDKHWYSLPDGYWCSLGIFAIISGLRWDVGVDHLSYLKSYERALMGYDYVRERGIEEGYAFVTNLFATIGLHPTIYFAFLAALQLFFVLLALKNENKRVTSFALAFIVLGGHYFTWMNGIRQMIVACSFMWAISFIREKKIFYYLLWIIFAYTWHHSVLILLPIFLIGYDRTIWDKKWVNIVILLLCIIVGNTPIWMSSMIQISDILIFMGYEHYSNSIERITDLESFSSFNWGPRMVANLSTYVIILFYYPNVRTYFKNSNVDIHYKLFFIGICLYYLFVNTNQLFLRPVSYFNVFVIPMAGFTLTYLLKRKRLIVFFVFLVASMSFTYLSCMSDASKPESLRLSYLYQFFQFK